MDDVVGSSLESDGSGTITSEYVFFGSKRIARRDISSGSIYYYEEDMLGSSRTLVQAGQTSLCYDADFYPFGGELQITTTCSQNYKFESKERDTETGNDDFGARYYSSVYGRWLSADWSSVPAPVPYANMANPQTLNLYAMVSDNPETFADLDGHCPGPNPSCDQTGGREFNASPCLNIPGSNGDCNPIGDNTPPDPGSALASSTQQNQCGFWCRLGQRFSNAFHGLGFHTDKQVEAILHRDNLFFRQMGISTEGWKMKEIMQTYDKIQSALRFGRHSVDVDGRFFILGMIGAGGPQFRSKTLWEEGPARIDVENPNPGVREGQMHYQVKGDPIKYQYNFENGRFEGLSNTQNENLLENPDVQRAIQRGYQYLGLDEPEFEE